MRGRRARLCWRLRSGCTLQRSRGVFLSVVLDSIGSSSLAILPLYLHLDSMPGLRVGLLDVLVVAQQAVLAPHAPRQTKHERRGRPVCRLRAGHAHAVDEEREQCEQRWEQEEEDERYNRPSKPNP